MYYMYVRLFDISALTFTCFTCTKIRGARKIDDRPNKTFILALTRVFILSLQHYSDRCEKWQPNQKVLSYWNFESKKVLMFCHFAPSPPPPPKIWLSLLHGWRGGDKHKLPFDCYLLSVFFRPYKINLCRKWGRGGGSTDLPLRTLYTPRKHFFRGYKTLKDECYKLYKPIFNLRCGPFWVTFNLFLTPWFAYK
jgi:hypothetical protein